MNTKTLALVAAVLAGLLALVGGAAMLVCVFSMFSSDSRDIMGAGLGFVGGTVLLGSSTIALAVVSTRRSHAPDG